MSTLSDVDIEKEIKKNNLIEGYDPKGISGACYELRMGSVYYDLTEDAKRICLKDNENVIIKPGHRVVLISKEKINVPGDILARTISKGSLFSIGLSPVATYADPGFQGNVGIVTHNISDKYVELPQLESIAKVEFARLSSAAGRLYQGQHGFQSGIWPIKTHFQKSHSEISRDARVGTERAEAFALLPHPTKVVIEQLERRQWRLNATFFILIVINAAALFAIVGDFWILFMLLL